MRAVVFGVCGWIVVMAAPARIDAQPPTQGEKVRVTTDSARVVGMMAASTSDSIRIAISGRADTVSVAAASIRELAVARGTRRHTLKGLGYGALGGAAIGATIRYIGFSLCTETGLLGCYLEPKTRGAATAIGAGIGAILGMGLGSAVGALIVTDRWTVVPTFSVH